MHTLWAHVDARTCQCMRTLLWVHADACKLWAHADACKLWAHVDACKLWAYVDACKLWAHLLRPAEQRGPLDPGKHVLQEVCRCSRSAAGVAWMMNPQGWNEGGPGSKSASCSVILVASMTKG